MKTVFDFLLRQNVFFNILFFGAIVFGVFFSIPKIPIDRYPNINFGEVVISTSYPGASAEEVERLVTEEIEDTLRGMENIEFIRSSSMTGYSSINVKFIDDTDYDFLYDQLRLRVLGSQNRLPTINGKPLTPSFNVTRVDDWLPVIQVNLLSSSPERPMDKRSLARLGKELQMELEKIDGVEEARIKGEETQQYTLTLNPEAMKAKGVTLADVQMALANSGGSQPAGTINTYQGERNIVVDDRFRNREHLLATAIRYDGTDSLLTLQDIVDLKRTGLERMDGGVITSVDGLDTISLQIVKADRANAKDIKTKVVETMEMFQGKHSSLPIVINTTLDSTTKIDDGLGVLQGSLTLALVLVMLAIFLFLSPHRGPVVFWVTALAVASLIFMVRFHEHPKWQLIALAINVVVIFITCRAAVLTVTGIVFSFLGCLILFQVLGYSLNEITLLGFVLTTGIIVDDAIVVLENIQRHREKGKELMEAAIDGTVEVFLPVFSASLTTIAAFLPMLIMTGSTGEFFALIPVAVSTALLISLIECLFIMPIHVVELEKLSGGNNEPLHEVEPSKLIKVLTRIYDQSLDWCLRNRWKSLGGVFLLFLMAIGILLQSAVGPSMGMKPLLKLEFFPDDTSNVQIIIRMPSNSTLEESDALARKVSNTLMELGPDKIKSATANAGLAVDSAYKPIFGSHLSFLMVELPAKADRSFENPNLFISEIRSQLEQEYEKNGIDLEVSAMKDGPPLGAPVHLRVSGVSEERVIALGEDLYQHIKDQKDEGEPFHGMTDLQSDRSNFTSTMRFHTARDQAMLHGLSPAEVRFFTSALFGGAYVGDLRMEDEDVPIRIQLRQDEKVNAEELLTFPLLEQGSKRIFFRDVGTWSLADEPSSLERRDFQRIINITSQIDPESTLQAADFIRAAKEWYEEQSSKYPGAALDFGGESESTARSYRSLAMAFFIAIFLIYGILSVQFQSYSQPFLIMANIVFSFTGVILMTGLLGGLNLILPDGVIAPERAMITVQSFIAIIGLTGLVVNDAIVLIDFINGERNKGVSLIDAVKTGAHHRVRPIIMTTWSTIAGLLPLAIGIPDFSITWGPFATCFVAGLTLSTLMTLLIIPVLYQMLEGMKSNFGWTSIPTKLAAMPLLIVGWVMLPEGSLGAELRQQSLSVTTVMDSELNEEPSVVLKSREKALEMVLAHHPELKSSQAMVLAQQHKAKQTMGDYAPQLLVSGQAGFQNNDLSLSNPLGKDQYHQLQGQISQFIYGFGQRQHRRLSTQKEVRISELDYRRVKSDMIRRVQQAYSTALLHQKSQEVNRRQVNLAKLDLERVRGLEGSGAATLLDLRRAEISHARATNQLKLSEQDFEASLLILQSLTGSKISNVEGELGGYALKPKEISVKTNLHLALLQEQVDLQAHLRKVTQSSSLPTLSVVASSSRSGYEWEDSETDWRGGLNLSWKLDSSRQSHHQALYHQELANQIRERQSALNREITQLSQELERKGETLEKVLETQVEIVQHAKDNHQTLVKLHKAGGTIFIRVQEALLEATVAELDLLKTQWENDLNTFQYHYWTEEIIDPQGGLSLGEKD